jgi:hypothetical protein
MNIETLDVVVNISSQELQTNITVFESFREDPDSPRGYLFRENIDDLKMHTILQNLKEFKELTSKVRCAGYIIKPKTK